MGSVEEQRRHQGYFVRLGSLSARLRHLAYEHSLGKLRQKKHHAQDTLAQLQETLELVRASVHPRPETQASRHGLSASCVPGPELVCSGEAQPGPAASSRVCSGLGQSGDMGLGQLEGGGQDSAWGDRRGSPGEGDVGPGIYRQGSSGEKAPLPPRTCHPSQSSAACRF